MRTSLTIIALAALMGGTAAAQPKTAESAYRSGVALEQHARFDEALAAMREAVRLAPASDLYLAALGDAAIKADRLDEARRALRDLRRLAIDHEVVPARIRILGGDLERAERLAAARASQHHP
ncbi:MAG TPA: hypothetical protein VIC33_11880 [Vicinamibacterales bacterium]|jgi:Flp pilus assembly protein TadD